MKEKYLHTFSIERYGAPSPPGKGSGVRCEEPDSFELGFPFLDVLQFRFHTLVLKKRDWRDYITSDNPVAAALLSKMGYKREEKVRVKVEFIRILTRLQLDPARMQL